MKRVLLALLLVAACRKAPAEEAAARRPDGGGVVLDLESQKRAGLVVAALVPAEHFAETIAYGRLGELPSDGWSLRTPLAGLLVPAAEGKFPRVGDRVDAGAVIAALRPRLTASERVDLAARLTTARGDEAWAASSAAAAVAEAEAADVALGIARSALERARTLNADGKNVSDRALQEAEGHVKVEEARARGARSRAEGEEARRRAALETRSMIEEALRIPAGSEESAGALPLRYPGGGVVVDVFANPGETVEAGQILVHGARYATLLARVDVPPGASFDEGASRARVSVLGFEEKEIPAELVGPAPSTNESGRAFWLRVDGKGLALRPGLAVTAFLPRTKGAESGVVVPRAAVVRHAGKAWAYAALADDRFERREVSVDRPVDAGFFERDGWKSGDRVVTTGAAVLLSAELGEK